MVSKKASSIKFTWLSWQRRLRSGGYGRPQQNEDEVFPLIPVGKAQPRWGSTRRDPKDANRDGARSFPRNRRPRITALQKRLQ
jgi:hypothetical protein